MRSLIDFTYDVLEGCIHNCHGCNVIKYDNRDITLEEIKRITRFFDNLNKLYPDSEYGILVLGPTDFLISENTLFILEHSQDLIRRFDHFGISSTMTYKEDNFRERIKLFKPFIHDLNLRITIPIHPKNIDNPKYHSLVDNNINILEETLDNINIVKLNYQLNINDFEVKEDTPIMTFTRDKLIGRVNDIDINIPDGRGNLKDLNQRMKLKHSILTLKGIHESFYKTHADDPNSLNQLYFEGTTKEAHAKNKDGKYEKLVDFDIVYSKGRIYRPGFFGDEIIVLDDSVSIPFREDPEVLDELEAKVLASQYSKMNEECSQCPLNSVCVDNVAIEIMNIAGIKSCMYPKENMLKTQTPTEDVTFTL